MTSRMARTESAFREVNEAIAETAARFEAEETDFVCECADPSCAHRLNAELDDYEEVRSSRRGSCSRRATRSRRSSASSSATGEYNVVEKFGPVVTPIVRQLDPRGCRGAQLLDHVGVVDALAQARRRARGGAGVSIDSAISAFSPSRCARRPCSRC